MTPGAALASNDIIDTPLTRAWHYLNIFHAFFTSFFEKPRPVSIPAHTYREAAGWLHGIEAIVRRVMFIEAAALIPGLPPARKADAQRETKAAAQDEVAANPEPGVADAAKEAGEAEETLGCPSLRLLKRPARAGAKATIAARRAKPFAQPARMPADLPPGHMAFRPIGRRFNAIFVLLRDPAAAARRLAFRIRAIQDKHRQPLCFGLSCVRLDGHAATYMSRDIDIFACDANDALRALVPDNSS